MDASKLKDLKLFDGLSTAELDQCAAMFEEQHEVLAGSPLVLQGDFSYRFFIVLDGEVKVSIDVEKHVATLRRGDFFGEMGVVSGERRNARVTAATRCTLATSMSWDLNEVRKNVPVVADRIQAVIDERVAASSGAADPAASPQASD